MVELSPTVVVPSKKTLSLATGAPGNCQFNRSDQLVVALTPLVPAQVTEGRRPTGPLASVSSTDVPSPLSTTLPTYDGEAAGRLPKTKLKLPPVKVIGLMDLMSGRVTG